MDTHALTPQFAPAVGRFRVDEDWHTVIQQVDPRGDLDDPIVVETIIWREPRQQHRPDRVMLTVDPNTGVAAGAHPFAEHLTLPNDALDAIRALRSELAKNALQDPLQYMMARGYERGDRLSAAMLPIPPPLELLVHQHNVWTVNAHFCVNPICDCEEATLDFNPVTLNGPMVTYATDDFDDDPRPPAIAKNYIMLRQYNGTFRNQRDALRRQLDG